METFEVIEVIDVIRVIVVADVFTMCAWSAVVVMMSRSLCTYLRIFAVTYI